MPEVVHFAHLMQQLVQGLQQLEQGQRQVLARIDNVRHRSYNKRVMQGPAPVLLKPLCREQAAAGGAHGPGALPPAGYFPADKQALFSVGAARA